MADHLLEDFHVTGGVSTGANWSESSHIGGAVDGSRQLFANNTAWHEGSCNLETNAGEKKFRSFEFCLLRRSISKLAPTFPVWGSFGY